MANKTREMVIPELAGLWVILMDGTIVYFVSGDEDTGGGVREPRRPNKPRSPRGATMEVR